MCKKSQGFRIPHVRNNYFRKLDFRILLFMKEDILNEESKITPRLRKLSIDCIGKLSKLKQI